ncbi:uncharacterized protein LOC135141452 [Zophobas morio]|uniref:uncharacterized protein LOC135141452 n=1 Tax=Zophobas morio TaxID=2755281 RepID=UPI003083B57D
MGITWEEFSELILDPFIHVISEAAFSLFLNMLFSAVVYRTTPRYFTSLACYFGFCHLFFLVPIDLCKFSLCTIYLFVAFYLLSLTFQKLMGWKYENTLKFFVFLNTLYCFRNYKNKDNIDDFILTYIVLTGKLFCAVDSFKKPSFKLLQIFTLLSYLTYAPWVSFKDFLLMPMNKQRLKNADWWLRMTSATPHAIIFKILSHNMLDLYYNTASNWLLPIVYSIIHGFQYRCRYYFHAQIVELQLLAAGVQARAPFSVYKKRLTHSTYKNMNWLTPYIFDLKMAESSTTVMSFLKRFNKPLTAFLYKKLGKRRNKSNKDTVFPHSMLILVLIGSYNFDYSVLSAGFLGGVMFQEEVFENYEELYGFCLHKCATPFCRHALFRRSMLFYFVNGVLLFHNQFRLSLVFVRHELMVLSSFVCNNYVVLTDLSTLILNWFVHEFILFVFVYITHVCRRGRRHF